tara:strand:- start:357 stop:2462 length:2106 start_codon:yes stop_codon:yes gene_type:complete
MPKIPTFTSEARPTAQAASVVSNIQIPLNETVAGALRPLGKAAEDYYIKEKEIETKVQAGELTADATVEVFNAASEAELKNTPQEGIDYFNEKFESIQNKYKAKAPNRNAGDLFNITFSSNKSVYVNNILKKTRTNLVTTRVNQVDQRVKSKIAAAVASGSKFEFDILAKSVEADYQGLVDDGIIGTKDLKLYKEKLPNLVEVAQVRKIATNNASQAFLILSDSKNFTTIKGEQRRKLISEFGTLAKQQADVTTSVLNQSIIEKSKKFMEKYGDNQKFGFSTEELEEFKTGNEEADNQIVTLNEKIVNKQFSFDTNFNTNTDVISKIASGEIKNTSTKFLLAGETEPKSILERAGDKTINNKDFKFLSNVIIRNNNDTFKKQDQQFLKYFENLTPLLQGNTFLNYFDKEYNAKASELRQTLHSRYLNGLAQGIQLNDLLSYTSENYIAKDIKNYLPKTSDLGSIIVEMAAENNNTIDGPPKVEGENAEQYLERIKNNQDIDVGDDPSAILDVDKNVQQVASVGDLILGKDRFLISNWNKYYQTDNSTINSLKARERLSRDYTVPNEAVSAIENAATNFAGDRGFSKETLIDYLTKIGQIETQYETKIQRGNNPEKENFYARSYWQIEVETAKDILKNSAPIFGNNFESTFSKKYKGEYKTAREGLLNLDNKDLVNLLEKDDTLAANIAAALIVTRFDIEKA